MPTKVDMTTKVTKLMLCFHVDYSNLKTNKPTN